MGSGTPAALFECVVGIEPLSPEMRRTHLAFLKRASERLLHR
jgi:hypothetical protein